MIRSCKLPYSFQRTTFCTGWRYYRAVRAQVGGRQLEPTGAFETEMGIILIIVSKFLDDGAGDLEVLWPGSSKPVVTDLAKDGCLNPLKMLNNDNKASFSGRVVIHPSLPLLGFGTSLKRERPVRSMQERKPPPTKRRLDVRGVCDSLGYFVEMNTRRKT